MTTATKFVCKCYMGIAPRQSLNLKRIYSRHFNSSVSILSSSLPPRAPRSKPMLPTTPLSNTTSNAPHASSLPPQNTTLATTVTTATSTTATTATATTTASLTMPEPSLYSNTTMTSSDESSKNSSFGLKIKQMLRSSGPQPVSKFMQLCLSSTEHSYYMKKDVFGRQGDFTTAPEISQIFGELVGIWLLQALLMQKKQSYKKNFQLVELGPGRGTLMHDIIRSFDQFRNKTDEPSPNAIFDKDFQFDVHLVETSPYMQSLQREALVSKFSHLANFHWHDNIETVPRNVPSLFVANEFFDALPISQFEYTSNGWRERFVAVDNISNEFGFVLAPAETLTSRVFCPTKEAKLGDHFEMSPASIAIAQQIADRLENDGGYALIIDYGNIDISKFTLRAFRDHKESHLFEGLGDSDITADVNFGSLMDNVKDKVNTYGPITQAEFLVNMGISQRIAKMRETAASKKDDPDVQKDYKAMLHGCQMLVDTDKMGERFKVIALSSKETEEIHPFTGLQQMEQKEDKSKH